MTKNVITPPVRLVFNSPLLARSEKPDTIDPVEFLRSSAIKWQNHARQTYMMIEILRDDPRYSHVHVIDAQKCHATESQVARERLFAYMETK